MLFFWWVGLLFTSGIVFYLADEEDEELSFGAKIMLTCAVVVAWPLVLGALAGIELKEKEERRNGE